MGDYKPLTGMQQKILRGALEDSVGDRATMDRILVEAGLERLHNLSPPGTFRNELSGAINTLDRYGDIDTLIRAVTDAFPRAPALKTLGTALDLAIEPPLPPSAPAGMNLERLVRKSGFDDPYPWAMRMMARSRAICRISYPMQTGVVAGTGFLIGPRTVLTNYHVIEDLHQGGDPTGAKLRFGDAQDAEGFDTRELHRLAPEWLGRHAPYSAADLSGGAGQPGAAELDFAELILAGDTGKDEHDAPRDAIDLGAINQPPPPGSILFILQHPEGNALKISLGVVLQGAPPHRIRYDADTLAGSSGGLVLDENFVPVALHHAGDPEGKLAADYNQGIPLAAIAAALGKGVDE